MAVLRLFPHCDMHLALGNAATKTIDFRLFRYLGASPFTLSDVTSTSSAQILAPHNPVPDPHNPVPPDRLESFVTIDFSAKTITATKVGTNLVIFREPAGDDGYIVARIQVHQDAQAWWFGNRNITTAVDTALGHSQPSIYAMFSNDPTGTDRVGDITGHGFVTLTSSDPAKFVVTNSNKEGRLRGVAEGHATLNGSFLGINDSMGVDVVDYSKPRDILVPVRAADLANAAKRHNMLFLAEGFKATDEAKFDQIVTEVTNDLFSKPRHEPFATLSPSFNVFKAFMPSNDRLITCGFQVADAAVPSLAKGTPIPFEDAVSDKGMYTVAQLVAHVGLPMRGETRGAPDLKLLWKSQSLDNFEETKVDPKVVEAWKNSHALGFLEARDTFLGMRVGSRWADKSSAVGPAITTPAADDGSATLKALVKRAYEFYKLGVARSVSLDGRRHPPELQLQGNESPTNTVMNFVNSLRIKDPPHTALGSNWVPTGTFKPSRGLIAMIINETMDGGTNLNDHTITANNVASETALSASYVADANANIKRLRRDEPADINPDVTSITNTVAHEFGHSFALGDEYEEFIEYPTFRNDFLDPADTRPNQFDGNFDNIASLEAIFNDPSYLTNNSRKIDPNKIKWRALPRIKLSAKSTAASQMNAGKLEIAIDPREANAWEAARPAGEEVHLRRIVVQPSGRQLPLSTVDADHLTGLKIDSVDVPGGKVALSSSSPLAPPPNFPEGSSLFIPYRTSSGTVLSIIEEKVFAELASSKDPLNKDPDTANPNDGPDFPREIGDFKPPCQSSRLIGLFEGGGRWTGLVYRPSGTCKMRTSGGADENGEFCHVCKWLITQRVDAGKHQEIDRKFYPKAKKNE